MFGFKKKEELREKIVSCKLCADNSEELLRIMTKLENFSIKLQSLDTQLKSLRQMFMQHKGLDQEETKDNAFPTQNINTKFTPFG